jgi:hypothetical protein
MSNVGLLLEYILKAIIVGVPFTLFVILTILIILKKKYWITISTLLFFFLISCSFAIYIFYNIKQRKNENDELYKGKYILRKLNCRDCENCIIDLKNNYTYDILKNNQLTDIHGKWDTDIEHDAGSIILTIDDDNFMDVDPLSGSREISFISKVDCDKFNYQEQLSDEFEGKIVDVKLNEIHDFFGYQVLIIETNNGNTIRYNGKYLSHPWLEKYFEKGDYIVKVKNTMNYKKVTSNGDTTFLKFEMRN